MLLAVKAVCQVERCAEAEPLRPCSQTGLARSAAGIAAVTAGLSCLLLVKYSKEKRQFVVAAAAASLFIL